MDWGCLPFCNSQILCGKSPCSGASLIVRKPRESFPLELELQHLLTSQHARTRFCLCIYVVAYSYNNFFVPLSVAAFAPFFVGLYHDPPQQASNIRPIYLSLPHFGAFSSLRRTRILQIQKLKSTPNMSVDHLPWEADFHDLSEGIMNGSS